ncbi:hypothetical protein OC844_006786 [Tilletia horrida]|nr:hypothetical protein OC844_006786 [Tilletia horrida]
MARAKFPIRDKPYARASASGGYVPRRQIDGRTRPLTPEPPFQFAAEISSARARQTAPSPEPQPAASATSAPAANICAAPAQPSPEPLPAALAVKAPVANVSTALATPDLNAPPRSEPTERIVRPARIPSLGVRRRRVFVMSADSRSPHEQHAAAKRKLDAAGSSKGGEAKRRRE